MSRKASVRDVAREAGVSIGSVSRVLNGGTYVSEDLRARVMSAVKKLGYRPDANARNLRTGSSKTIGCLIPDISNPLYAAYVSAIETRLQEEGYMLLLGTSKGSLLREQEIMQLFETRNMDGIIAAPLKETEQTELFSQCNLPLVILDRDLEIKADHVNVDHRSGIIKATEYLFSLGHKRIVLLTPGAEIRPGRERIEGYREAHQKAGYEIDETLIRPINPRLISSYEDTRNLLASKNPPTAIISLGTQILSSAMRAIHEANLQIPHDISIIAIGTSDTVEFAYPPLTLLRFDLNDYGQTAADLILSRIRSGNKSKKQTIIKPIDLTIASSCKKVADNTNP